MSHAVGISFVVELMDSKTSKVNKSGFEMFELDRNRTLLSTVKTGVWFFFCRDVDKQINWWKIKPWKIKLVVSVHDIKCTLE